MSRYVNFVIFVCFFVIHQSFVQQNSSHDYFSLGSNTTFKVTNVALLHPEKEFSRNFALRAKFYTKVLTNEMCKTVPNVDAFNYISGSLTSIERNAFEKCTDLTRVQIRNHSISSLAAGLFDKNLELLYVDFSDNKLKTIDENLFRNNVKLWFLNFESNRLSSLPPNLFKHIPNLSTLRLSGNPMFHLTFLIEMPVMQYLQTIRVSNTSLLDVDVDKLTEKCPSLEIFWINDNKFSCEREQRIVDVLTEKEVDCYLNEGKGSKCIQSSTTQSTTFDNSPITIQDLENRITELQSRPTFSNILIIVLGSIVTISIFVIFCGCLLTKFRTQSCERRPALEQLYQEERKGLSSNGAVNTNKDNHYEAVSKLDADNHYLAPLSETAIYDQLYVGYERLNFNNRVTK